MKFIKFLIIFGFVLGHSQKQGIITYKIIPADIDKIAAFENVNPVLKKSFKEGNKEKSNMKLELTFKDDESYFKLIDKLPSQILNQTHYNLLVNGKLGNSKYYVNKKEKLILREYNEGGNFLLSTKFDELKWKLTKEKKMIGEYLCFKAVTTKKIFRGTRVNTIPIEAWYCPTIPISFGPFEFCNLPGLVLELKERYDTYGVVSIDFTPEKEIKIKRPIKGIKKTQKEFTTGQKPLEIGRQ